MTSHNFFDNFVLVYGHIHSLPNPNVFPRTTRFAAKRQKYGPSGRTINHLELRVLNDFLVQLNGNTRGKINLPGNKCGKSRRWLLNGFQLNLLDRWSSLPIVLIGFHLYIGTLYPLHKLIGAGSYGYLLYLSHASGFCRLFIHYIDLMEIVGEPWDRVLGFDNHSIVIDDVN